MANVLVEEKSLTAIANSIRGKNGTTNTYKPAEMPAAIDAIETGGVSEVRYPNFYYDSRGSDANSFLQSFDVSNATTLTFLYDYASASYPCTGTIKLYLGYGIYKASGAYYSYTTVDATSATQTVLSSNRTNFTNRTLTIDVSNYTSVVLYTSFASNSSSYSASGCICIHDIVIS